LVYNGEMKWMPCHLHIASRRFRLEMDPASGRFGGAMPVASHECMPEQLFDGYVDQIAGLYLVRHDR
jgi:hypothetical protein